MTAPTGILLNDRYLLDDELGHGGMGVVFQGWDTLLQRNVAIKILNREFLGAGGADRLLEEARVIASMDHPNIVTLFDAGKVEGNAFLVMQLVDGYNLSSYDSPSLDAILSIGVQICSGLAHAHEKGVVHRDLKPDNIFLTGSFPSGGSGGYPQLKIVDFGIAHSESANLTMQGEISGTVSYMAPEQAMGQVITPKTDLYALGVILYELTTGQLPFRGDNPLNVISQHINAPVSPPDEINPEVPADLAALIASLLNKSPQDRPASALEVEKRLNSMQQKEKLDSDSIPGQTIDTPKRNLPEQLTSFVGRHEEMLEISDLLSQNSCRLLTLVGPGGIGKTRLAIEAANHNASIFKDGVAFISLASLSEPNFILPAIADCLGITLQTHGSIDPESQLFDYLVNRDLLLVFDNFEHLIDGTELLVNLLKRTQAVKLLVTSRQRLNIQGEWTFNLGGLPIPDNVSEVGELSRSSIQLFTERARLADARFVLEEEDHQHVIHICQSVGGMPLGIELASAWANILSPREIAEEIEKNLDFLTTTRQDTSEKHRSMRAAFDYSWKMLSQAQQEIFQRLSIFRGGFSRMAAAEITGAGLMELSVIVDRSFIRREANDRYQVHELLRQFGQEKLQANHEEFRKTGELHSQYYFKFLNERRDKIVGETQLSARDEILAEIENVRSAIHWGILERKNQEVLRAFQILRSFYFVQGYYDGVETFKSFAGFIKDLYNPGYDPFKPGGIEFLAALTYQANYLSMLGAVERSEEIAKKLPPGLREHGAVRELSECLMSLGINASYRGDYEKAENYLIEAIQLAESIHYSFGIIGNKIWLGWAYYEHGNYDEAQREWLEGQDLALQINNLLLLAFVQSKLALLGEETGDYESAIKIQFQARENFMQFNDQVGVGYATSRMALSLIGIGEYREAKRFGQEALQCYQDMNHRWGIPASLCRIGFAEIELGEMVSAWEHISEALKLSIESQIGTLVLYALIGLGKLLVNDRQVEQGISILSYVVADPITPSLYRQLASQSLAELRRELPAELFGAAESAGKEAKLEEIIETLPSTLQRIPFDQRIV